MSCWPSSKARQVFQALLRKGWVLKREAKGSHKVLSRSGFPDFVFSFHDKDEIGPRMLARIARRTGLEPQFCAGVGFQLTRFLQIVRAIDNLSEARLRRGS